MAKKLLIILFLLLFCIGSVYAGDRRYVCQTLTYSATKSLSPPVRGDSYYFINSVTGNISFSVKGGVQGDGCIFFLTSDVVGGHIMTFSTGFTSTGTMTLIASQTSVVRFTYTGSTWKEEYRMNGNTGGGVGLPTAAQGDTLYASAVDIWSNLAKNATATRYLSNTGVNNNPAWAQVALATGVSGTLPVSNGGTGTTSIPAWITTYYIPINIMQAVLWADSSNNTVTITSDHDNTNFRNYIRATSSTAAQDYDIVIEFQIPTDFGSFPASCLSVDTRTSDKTNCACTISMYIAAGTVDAGVNGASITPTVADNVWYSFTDTPTGAYVAGDWVHIHIHISTGDGTPDTFDVSRLTLKYTKA
jgi:hypothetical protein